MAPLKVVTRELVRAFVRSLMVLENILNRLSFGGWGFSFKSGWGLEERGRGRAEVEHFTIYYQIEYIAQ